MTASDNHDLDRAKQIFFDQALYMYAGQTNAELQEIGKEHIKQDKEQPGFS